MAELGPCWDEILAVSKAAYEAKKVQKAQSRPEVKGFASILDAPPTCFVDPAFGQGLLSYDEERFIRDVQLKMAWSALPRKRKKYILTGPQKNWFKAIYLRVVRPGKEARK